MDTPDSNYNSIFYSFLGVILIVIIIMSISASKQNEYYKVTQAKFYTGLDLYQKEMVKQAEPLLKEASESYPQSYNAWWLYGDCLFKNQRFAEASVSLNKAEQLRPALLANPQFLLMHASALYESHHYENASLYVNQAMQNNNMPEELRTFANNMLERINQKVKKK